MSTHIGFLLVALASLLVSAPMVALTWRYHLAYRGAITTYYVVGYSVIAAAFILDDIVAPPLFVHGFIPGVGVAQLLFSLALFVRGVCTIRIPRA